MHKHILFQSRFVAYLMLRVAPHSIFYQNELFIKMFNHYFQSFSSERETGSLLVMKFSEVVLQLLSYVHEGRPIKSLDARDLHHQYFLPKSNKKYQ